MPDKEDKGWETEERLTLNVCKMLVFINAGGVCSDRTACRGEKNLFTVVNINDYTHTQPEGI